MISLCGLQIDVSNSSWMKKDGYFDMKQGYDDYFVEIHVFTPYLVSGNFNTMTCPQKI